VFADVYSIYSLLIKVQWGGYVIRMRRGKVCKECWWRHLLGSCLLEKRGDIRIISGWFLERSNLRTAGGWKWVRTANKEVNKRKRGSTY
jgi:hypothetical protein